MARFTSTSTPLAANGVFTSDILNITSEDAVSGTVSASHSGILYTEFSSDGGTTWTVKQTQAVSGGIPLPLKVETVPPYTRIRYVNGGTPQTSFNLKFRASDPGSRNNTGGGSGGSSGGGGSVARATLTKTTGSLAANASETGTVDLGKSFRVVQVVSTKPVRVRLYATAAQRTADASRAFSAVPSGNHGVLLDVQTAAGSLTQVVSPAADGSNLEGSPTASISYSITNVDSTTGSADVTFTYFTTEA